ncbi:MAG: DNA polymerase III subunit [Polyangiaceae bacterium]|nr:DNA polymerase III subunit [Polyangiaceae bacterium]
MSGVDLLSRLKAQETAKRTILEAIRTGRVHHAYLFAGPDGVGKELAAFGLAQALVCEKRDRDIMDKRACGQCSSCLRAVPRDEQRLPIHPDVVVLERGLYAPETIGRRTPETQDLSIDQVRTLVIAHAAYPPHEGRAKVFIVRRAEELSVSAANALLKTLEEPLARTHFVLLTSQPESLLPTIRSRTLRVRFGPLPDDVVAELLEASGVAPARAREVAHLAEGSMATGAALANPLQSETREAFVARAFAAVDAKALDIGLALAEDAKKDKGALAAHVAALATAFAARASAAAKAASPNAVTLAKRGNIALLALDHLAGNGAPQLVVEAMIVRMRAV